MNNTNEVIVATLTDSIKNTSGLQLSKIEPNPEYLKEWNETSKDFVCLTFNGKLISNNLYRIGGLNTPNLEKDRYFMLLKYVEAHYSEDILRMCKSNKSKHLEGRWCIFDRNGAEKKEFPYIANAYLTRDSCLYSIGGKYYNIETDQCYGNSSGSMSCDEFLFLDNKFEKDPLKRGVVKVNKQDGTWELFPIKE